MSSEPSAAPQPLPGRIALVTGGSGGLGRAVVSTFREAGAEVHVPVHDEGEIPGLRTHLDGDLSGIHLHRNVDLTRAEGVEELFRALPPVEVVANLAGGFAMASVEETEPDMWDRMFRINATTAFLVSRAAFPAMRAKGFGRILTVSAFPAVNRGAAGMAAYGAAKAAVLNLTQVLAREGAEHGITANAVLPSIIDTPANREAMPDADRSTWITPVEIARILRFLASDEAAVLTGAALPLTRKP